MVSQEGQGGGPRGLGAEGLESLLARLGSDAAAGAAEYGRLHRRLLAFFESHGSLEPDRAELLVAYYAAARSSNRAWRAELAASRGQSLNALRIRVFRAREALRESLAGCLAEEERP